LPLVSGSSQQAISSNIKELRHSGYPEEQSIAIAERNARKSKEESMRNISFNDTNPQIVPNRSKRNYDGNGWPEIKGNPISKVGVFPYSGAQIGHEGLETDKIYNVYRPASELCSPEAMNSFKLLPFTNGHAMLGSESDDLIPAEVKGVEGVTGEDVYFDHPYLRANLKIFSENAHQRIEEGIKDISIGYRCEYEMNNGVYDGQPYEFIQRNLRGNHVANVEEGRSGPDVAVLDRLRFTLDSKDITMPDMNKPEEKPEDLEKPEGKDESEKEMEKKSEDEKEKESEDRAMDMKTIYDSICSAKSMMDRMMGGGQDAEPDMLVKRAEITDDESEKKEDEKMEKETKDKFGKGMDAKTFYRDMAQRDILAEKLSYHVGTFDHKEKTLEEVAEYGVKKLGISCKRGHEQSVLQGYLAAAKVSPVVNIAQDCAAHSSQIDDYLQGAK